MRRGWEVACVIAAAVLVTLFWLSGEGGRMAVMAAWVLLMVAGGAAVLVWQLRRVALPADQRPQRFVVTPAGFVAPSPLDRSMARGPLIFAAGAFLTIVIESHSWFQIAVVAAAVTAAARNLRRRPLTLTPAGVTLGPGRTIPWGQPFQVPRELTVNPWFVSAAIQWYAHHPEERSTIGTAEGHERLRTALGAIDVPEVVPPPRSPMPPNLVRATWLTWFGVVAAIVSAAVDVVLAYAYRSTLEHPDPDFPGDGSDWSFIAGSTVVWLVVTALAGAFAIAVLYALRQRPSNNARVALVVFAVAALAAAFNPMGSPILALADIDGLVGLGVLLGWITDKAATGVPALLVLIQLSSPPVREYASPAGR